MWLYEGVGDMVFVYVPAFCDALAQSLVKWSVVFIRGEKAQIT